MRTREKLALEKLIARGRRKAAEVFEDMRPRPQAARVELERLAIELAESTDDLERMLSELTK